MSKPRAFVYDGGGRMLADCVAMTGTFGLGNGGQQTCPLTPNVNNGCDSPGTTFETMSWADA